MTKGGKIPPFFMRCPYGAGDGVRTRDPELGKLVLYQLSYTRIQTRLVAAPAKARRKGQQSDKAQTALLTPKLLPCTVFTAI